MLQSTLYYSNLVRLCHVEIIDPRLLEPAEMGPVRDWRRGPAHRRAGRSTPHAPAGAAVDLAGPRHRRPQHPAGDRAVPGARRHLARLPPLSRRRACDRARGHRDSRLVRFQRRHHPRAVARPGRARGGDLCGGYARSRRFGNARRYRLCRPARGRPCRLRRVPPQDRAERTADAGRPFLRRRLCAAGGRFADPKPVRSHRAARALSRLSRAHQPAEFGRLGQRRCPAHPRPAGATRDRHQLLRGAAGAGVRGAAEFREDPGAGPIPTG